MDKIKKYTEIKEYPNLLFHTDKIQNLNKNELQILQSIAENLNDSPIKNNKIAINTKCGNYGYAYSNKGNFSILVLANCDIKTLPDNFYNLTNITYLDLSKNHLTDVSEKISNLNKLRTFSLAHNNLTILPSGFWTIKSLKELNLRDNHFKTFPEEIKQLERLEELNLMDNPLESLPSALSNLEMPSLNYIRLNNDHAPLIHIPSHSAHVQFKDPIDWLDEHYRHERHGGHFVDQD